MPLKLNRKVTIQNPPEGQARPQGLPYINKPAIGDVTTGAPMSIRALMALAESPQGLFNILEHRYGKGNVQYIDGRLAYRINPASEKFIAVDEDQFTIRDLIDLLGQAPEAIGATIGAIGLPGAGGIPGAAAGGVLGYGIKSGLRETLMPGAEPTTSGQETRRSIMAGLSEGLGQGTGHLITNTASKIAKGFSGKLVPEEAVASRILGESGSFLTPAQATDSRLLDITENVAEASLLGGGKITAFKESQKNAVDSSINAFVEGLGREVHPEELGSIVIDTLDKRLDLFSAATKRLYKRVDNLTQGAAVSTQGLKTFASEALERRGQVPKSLTGSTGQTLLEEVLNLPDSISFQNAQFLRSELLRGTRDIGLMREVHGDISIGIMEALAKHTDQAMEKAAQNIGPEAIKAFRRANSVYKIGKEKYNNRLITQLVRQGKIEPEAVGRKLLQRGHPAMVQNLKRIFKPNEWPEVQSGFMQKVLMDATDPATDELKGVKLLSFVNPESRGSYGDAFLNAMFKPEQKQRIIDLAKTLRLIQSKQAEGTGKMAIQLAQMGSLGVLLSGGLDAARRGAMTIIAGPVPLARLLTSEKWANRLIHGIQLSSRGGKFADEGTKVLTRLFAQAVREGVIAPTMQAELQVGGTPTEGLFPKSPVIP